MKNLFSKLMIILILPCLISFSVYSQNLPISSPEEAGLSSERLKRIKRALMTHIDKDELAGAVVLVARNGKVAYFKAFGKMNIEENKSMRKDAIFRIASMTKLVTSAAVMVLYENGNFMLNDPVKKYIPEFGNFKVAVPVKRRGNFLKTVPLEKDITIRDLLRHTSGISYGMDFNHVDKLYNEMLPKIWKGSLADFVGRLPELPLAYQPGTKWEYSLSTDVLGYLIEVISGNKFDEFLKKNIFKPLKMKDTDFYITKSKLKRFTNVYQYTDNGLMLIEDAVRSRFKNKPEVLSGGGGLLTTTVDYARFLQMLLNGGELEGKRILSRKTIELMFTDHLAGIDNNWLNDGVGFGLGIAVLKNPGKFGDLGSKGTVWWSGTYNTFFFIDPIEKMFGLLMTQMSSFVLHNLGDRFRVMCLQAVID